MGRTFGEIFGRVASGLTPEEIRKRYQEIVDEDYEAMLANPVVAEKRLVNVRDRDAQFPDDISYEDQLKLASRLLIQTNLGYYLGYHDKETREQWYAALPQVAHPIFGADFGRDDPTPEEAFATGVKLGEEQLGD